MLVLFAALTVAAAGFDGARALEATRRVVAFGVRTPGSPGMLKMQAWIVSELKTLGWQVIEDRSRRAPPRAISV